ncbi:Slam-dependent surface lipoprotein [Aggregatibacter kilianii]|uniref:Slam-dependent surface lipoprotein n=1 Tax=Aggregatibacter kilianii TaxID=2025884 RepID=UPI0013A60DA8|nr:Slam-dependent surface lipoprotein [Aggregatibacter kilianii]
MRMLTKTTIAIAVLTMVGTASAATVGGVSRTTDKTKYVQVGNSTQDKAKAGIDIAYPKVAKDTNTANNKYQSFSKIASMAGKWYVPSSVATKDSNQVYVARMYAMPKAFAVVPMMPEHRDLGRMSFKQVGNQDVWFGDWEDVPRNSKNAAAQSSKYTVYYAGSNPTTAAQLPKSGQATYTVVGINKHRGPNTAVLKGEMKADFGAKTLNGTIARSGLSVAVNSKINADASFNGTAKANNSVNGISKGHFYGNQAAALAGIADFGAHNQYNTAFGGTKK